MLVKNKMAMAGLGILILISLTALLAATISPYDPNKVDILHQLEGPSRAHILGTDL
jgi:peptide/nickel transport system permease protein